MRVDFAGEGLLDGLNGEARASREQLLARLAQDGFTLTQLRDAVAEDRLILLGLDRVLGGSYTAEEVQARSGLPAETIVLVRRMLGLSTPGAGDRVFSDEDIEAAQSAQRFLDAGFTLESISEITRVLGEGMARLAATITAAFAETYLAAGDSEEAVAARFETMARELTPVFTPVLVSGFTAQLRDSVGRAMLGRAELEAGDVTGAQDVAVAFADLVGFTRLAGQVELRQLSGVAGRLAELAAEVALPPVRLVKTIGDAAMFVSRDPARPGRRRARARRRRAGGRAAQPARRSRAGARRGAGRRLLRPVGQSGQSRHGRGPAGQCALHDRGARGRPGGFHLVGGGPPPPQRRVRRRAPAPRAAPRPRGRRAGRWREGGARAV